jgi:RNA polymerase sigma-70 factor, ECF subfamily
MNLRPSSLAKRLLLNQTCRAIGISFAIRSPGNRQEETTNGNGSNDSRRWRPRARNDDPQRDHEPLDVLFLRYSPVLYRIAFRKLGNAEDAEDALQDALLSAFKNMHQFRGEARFSTWLGSIVLNSARMQLRRRLNHNLVSLDQHDENHEEGDPIWAERLEDGSPDAEESLRRAQTRETLERIVEELPARLRVAFRLRAFEGLTNSEAAAALGVPEGTLKAQLFRARMQVTARMRQAINSPGTQKRTKRWSRCHE